MLTEFMEERIMPVLDGCWLWTGAYTGDPPYGLHKQKGNRGRAHRFVYEALVGPIPDGMTIDHLCRQTMCVNPEHLEVVTVAENIKRSPRVCHDETHEWFESAGQCRTCMNDRRRELRARRRHTVGT